MAFKLIDGATCPWGCCNVVQCEPKPKQEVKIEIAKQDYPLVVSERSVGFWCGKYKITGNLCGLTRTECQNLPARRG
jgi:hypothetical protein